jgi:5-methyltetrahydrofolate--homocysteine methyltransferase
VGALLYRPDWLEARDRLTVWWNGGDIGRPAFLITVPRPEPWEEIEVMPEPPGWVTHYSTSNLPYRVNLALRSCLGATHVGEAVPTVTPGDLAPNCLALYLGCHGVEMPDTVWCEPFIDEAAEARFEYDPDNFYWRFTVDAYSETLRLGRGKFLHQFPDLIEGLDTLAAMRGTARLLIDLLERPDWVHACLRQITDRYFHYYDILYDMFRDEVGGCVFWAWAPGRMAKFQCDFSAMISAAMFRDFMAPVLTEMTERVSYSMYHWDGPGAIQHLDTLLSIPKLDMIQWTPGAGAEPTWHERWWPLYHSILDAGKKVFLGGDSLDQLLPLKREFGEQCKNMLIGCWAPTLDEAESLMKSMEL